MSAALSTRPLSVGPAPRLMTGPRPKHECNVLQRAFSFFPEAATEKAIALSLLWIASSARTSIVKTICLWAAKLRTLARPGDGHEGAKGGSGATLPPCTHGGGSDGLWSKGESRGEGSSALGRK